MKKQEKANQPPDKTVRNYVKSFFEPIRYSGEVSEAKEKITEALEPVYAQMKRENETEAFAGFVARYPNLEALLEAAGLDREKTAQWRSKASTVPLQDFLIRFKMRRKQLWITVSLFAFAAVYLAAVALSFGDLWLVKLAVGLALAAAGVLLTLRFRKKRSAEKYVLSVDDYGRAEKLFDRYGRKSVNWLMILFLEVFVVAFRVISLGVNSKAAEIAEQESSIQKNQEGMSNLEESRKQDDEFVKFFEAYGNIQQLDREIMFSNTSSPRIFPSSFSRCTAC